MAAKYIGRWSNSGPPRTRELSPIVKKIWLSIHPINFGIHVTVHPAGPHHGETNGEIILSR